MASLTFAKEAIQDLQRLADFLREGDDAAAASTARLIREALAILQSHPLVGYEVERGWRQLVISRGRSGYLALYEYQPAVERVIVRAIRHQREAGFDD